MNKIPVGRVVSESYTFAIKRYLPLLGVVWLPMLISLLVSYFLFVPAILADAGQGLHPAGSFGMMFALDGLQFVLMAVISVGITKEALGVRERPRFVYLAVGRSELRVMGGYILLGILTLVFCFGVGILGAIIAGIVIATAKGASGFDLAANTRMAVIAGFIALLGIMSALLYFWIRLASFLTAVSVAEHRFGLWRSWTLTRGNFWRLFAIVLTIGIPLVVASCVVLWLTMGPAYVKMMAAVSAGPEALHEAQRELLRTAMSTFHYNALIFFPLAPIFDALMMAPGAFAYRALVASGSEPSTNVEAAHTD